MSNLSESLPSLFCHERPERIAHGCSFVKSDGSESQKSLLKKEELMSEERRERIALGHKKGGKSKKKTVKRIQKYNFFRENRSFFASDTLDHEQITRIAFLKCDESDLLFKMSDFERKSEFPTLPYTNLIFFNKKLNSFIF